LLQFTRFFWIEPYLSLLVDNLFHLEKACAAFFCLFEDKKFLIFMPFDVLQPLFLLKSPQK